MRPVSLNSEPCNVHKIRETICHVSLMAVKRPYTSMDSLGSRVNEVEYPSKLAVTLIGRVLSRYGCLCHHRMGSPIGAGSGSEAHFDQFRVPRLVHCQRDRGQCATRHRDRKRVLPLSVLMHAVYHIISGGRNRHSSVGQGRRAHIFRRADHGGC